VATAFLVLRHACQYKPTALAVWTAGRRTSHFLFGAGSPNNPPSPRYREGLLSRGAFIGVCHDDCLTPNPIQAHGDSRRTAGRRTSRWLFFGAGSPNNPPSPRYREGLLLVFATTIAAHPTQYKPTAIAVWTCFTRRGPSMALLRLPGLRPEVNRPSRPRTQPNTSPRR